MELASNRYDFTVAAARLGKLAARIKQLGRSYGATKVVVACLWDFPNSDRRFDELHSNATNRSKSPGELMRDLGIEPAPLHP